MNVRAHIGLGANLDDPSAQLRWALARLAPLGRVAAESPFYRSAPMGPRDQPDFCNAVCILECAMPPEALMAALLDIERQAGRVRTQKWGPRTLDLDLLHVEGTVLSSALLTLPHPGIASRNFVLVPWADIAPDLVVPGIGQIAERARQIGREDLQLWSAAG